MLELGCGTVPCLRGAVHEAPAGDRCLGQRMIAITRESWLPSQGAAAELCRGGCPMPGGWSGARYDAVLAFNLLHLVTISTVPWNWRCRALLGAC